jgi:hypothetical protein
MAQELLKLAADGERDPTRLCELAVQTSRLSPNHARDARFRDLPRTRPGFFFFKITAGVAPLREQAPPFGPDRPEGHLERLAARSAYL